MGCWGDPSGSHLPTVPSSEPSTVPQGWFHHCWSSAARPVLGAKPHSVYCICISPTHKVSVQAKLPTWHQLTRAFPSLEPPWPLAVISVVLSELTADSWEEMAQASPAKCSHPAPFVFSSQAFSTTSFTYPLFLPGRLDTGKVSCAPLLYLLSSIRNYLLPSGRGGREALILTKARLALCSTPHSLVFL